MMPFSDGRKLLSASLLGMLVICEYAIAYFAKTCMAHIAYFSAYNGIFKIAYAKIMPHMLHIQKFAYIRSYAAYSAYVISFFHLFCLALFLDLNIFGSKRLTVFTIRR